MAFTLLEAPGRLFALLSYQTMGCVCAPVCREWLSFHWRKIGRFFSSVLFYFALQPLPEIGVNMKSVSEKLHNRERNAQQLARKGIFMLFYPARVSKTEREKQTHTHTTHTWRTVRRKCVPSLSSRRVLRNSNVLNKRNKRNYNRTESAVF